MKLKLILGLLIILLLAGSVNALMSEKDLAYQQKNWFQKIISLPLVVSGSTTAVPGEAKTYYEVIDNYVLGDYCNAGTVQKARMIMYDSVYNVLEDSGVLSHKTIVVGADAYDYTFIMPYVTYDTSVKIIGKVYCQKPDNTWGWITDPHSKTVTILSGGCQSMGCPDNGFVGTRYCSDNNVYQGYRTYTCGSDGVCHSTTTKKLVLDCVSMNEKCNLDTGDTCVNPNYCYSNSDCHSSYYSGSYCSGNQVVKDKITYSCNNHYCVEQRSPETQQQCGTHETCESGVCVEQAYCGDGVCNNGETYITCPSDCEAPTGYCGDGICNNGETYTTCPGDCANPNPTGYCGDGTCNNGETYTTCPADCENLGYCGDGICNNDETTTTCPSDCASSNSNNTPILLMMFGLFSIIIILVFVLLTKNMGGKRK